MMLSFGREERFFQYAVLEQIQSVSLHFRAESMARPQAM